MEFIELLFQPTYAFWILFGLLLVIFEVVIIAGIGFLFAGLGALTLGSLLAFEIFIVEGWTWQIAYFFFLTTVWWLVLWSPLQRALKSDKERNHYSDIIGNYAIIDEEGGLKVGKMGYVKWNGTRMRARINPKSNLEVIDNGQDVWVHDNRDGIFYVDVEKPDFNSSPDDDEFKKI
jgi:membrane protein implicated in regulation of membrane protease activity